FRIGKPRVSPEINARDLSLVSFDDRGEHALPTIGAVDVTGTWCAAFQVAELVEHEQRMIAGAGVMAVPDAVLLFAVRWTHARIHVKHDAFRRATTMDDIDPLAGKIGERQQVLFGSKPLRLEPSHLAR